ncbi:uncharacterized protein [Montipora foliosa]|uniref:uncharacterized protein n=1 Tax=Montipora foliosa TaxID=591990 RepID=UPI0035F204F0
MKSSVRKRKRFLFLTILLVFVKVNSVCIEQDCLPNKSIQLINAKTGECITCFPCLDCSAGSPSVACGSTVHEGTDISCDGPVVNQDPLITATPSMAVHATNSTHVAPSNSSAVNTASAFTGYTGPNVTPENTESGSIPSMLSVDKVIGIPIASFLLMAVILFVYKQCRTNGTDIMDPDTKTPSLIINNSGRKKSELSFGSKEWNGAIAVAIPPSRDSAKGCVRAIGTSRISEARRCYPCSSHQEQPLTGQQNRERMQAPKGNGDDPEVCFDPVAGSARFVPTYPGGPQTCISNDLEVANTGAQVPKSCTCGLTNIHALWPNHNSMDQPPKGAKWSALTQAEKYNTKMLEVPFLLLYNIYFMLDIKRSDGNDIRQFADKLGITVQEFDRLEHMAKFEGKTSSELILKEVFVDKHPTDTVGAFIRILEDMQRDDIISLIKTWKE